MTTYIDATLEQVNETMHASQNAFRVYKRLSIRERANFMRTVARCMEELSDVLVETAMRETNLPKPRLAGEMARTILQLNTYAAACERGEWLQVRIDKAVPERNPPKADLRKTQIPLGPIVVFGASNFPFAYSTAGGDTACAFAAGCTVVVKAHPAHPETSTMVASAIHTACRQCGLPADVFCHIYGAGNEVGKALVMHPNTKSVAFTGSFGGGKALFEWGSQRAVPIPVFAEMGSVNPVFLLPEKMREMAEEIAKMYAASITLSAGQFCTKPGLILGIEGVDFDHFKEVLAAEIKLVEPANMLHIGIAKAFKDKQAAILQLDGVTTLVASATSSSELQASPAIANVSGDVFLQNTQLHQEIFGPYTLVVGCKDFEQLIIIAASLEGQLTAAIMGTDKEITVNTDLVETIRERCGRIILNGVPTGVEVCLSMHHGGPFPATTDARFTAVGADGIRRFSRPVCYQNWSNELLPEELKDGNPLGIWRTINDRLTMD